MLELGKKSDVFGVELLQALEIYSRPTSMPIVPSGHEVVCGYDQGLGERMIVCETLEEMQELYDAYARGGALRIYWYSAPDVGFITIVSGDSEGGTE